MFNRQSLHAWVEEYLFYPSSFSQKILSFLLLPFSFLYCIYVILKRVFSKKIDYGIPIVSIGNLTVGGSGKTPFLIALCKDKKEAIIILRGYKRESKGLQIVSKKGSILCDVKRSGDEAMEYAKALPKATVIVSEDRDEGIQKAIGIGAQSIFLDDAFSKSHIKKLDILLQPSPEPKSSFCLPSGPYREPKFFYKKADIVAVENEDFTREVKIKNPTKRMLLITAIAKPKRLEPYLNNSVIAKVYFEDHYMFKEEEIKKLLQKYDAQSVLTTNKDAVKMQSFDIPLSVLDLQIHICSNIQNRVNTFLSDFR